MSLKRNDHKKILFGVKAHTRLKKKNPQAILETQLLSQKVTGCVFALYVIKIEAGHNVTVNGECYKAMANERSSQCESFE